MDAIDKLFAWAEDNHYLISTKDMINAASKQFTALTAENAELRDKLGEAEGLLERAVRGGELSPGEWASLQCDIAGFLTPPTSIRQEPNRPEDAYAHKGPGNVPPELWDVPTPPTSALGLGEESVLSQSKYMPGVGLMSNMDPVPEPVPYPAKTPLGKRLMALRQKGVIDKGLPLLSAEEITGEDMVMVRRTAVQVVMPFMGKQIGLLSQSEYEGYQELKSALAARATEGEGEPKP